MITRDKFNDIASELKWRDALHSMIHAPAATRGTDAIVIERGLVRLDTGSHPGLFKARLIGVLTVLLRESNRSLAEMGFDPRGPNGQPGSFEMALADEVIAKAEKEYGDAL